MAAYHIRFIKTLSDENDHSETVYRSIVIRLAGDAVRAVAAAKRQFERLERVNYWRLRADRMKIDSLTGQIIRRARRCCTGANRAIWRSYQELDNEQHEETLDTVQ
jgi:hypothetical protein